MPEPVQPSATADVDSTTHQIRGSTLILSGRGLSVALNFLTQVLTVRYLAKSDYGALAYALAMASFLGHVSRVGMDKAVSRFAAIEDEREEYGRMFGTLLFALGLVVVCGLSIAAGVITLGDSLGPAVVSDPLSLHLLMIVIALAPVEALDTLMQSVFAIFSKPQLIFFRKYVVGPSLKLLAVVSVMLAAGDARTLAVARLVAGVLGLAIGLSLAGRVLRERDLLRRFRWRSLEVRARKLLGYSLPMLGSDAVILLRGVVVVFLLEYLHGSDSVADFRSVLPVARLNGVAVSAFAFLFIPAVARLTEQGDTRALNSMYWRSATWVTTLSLPIFLVTFCLARPVTVFLFGERYAGAAGVLALLAAGYFVADMLSMSGHALKAAGRVRQVLVVDSVALVFGLALTVLLVFRYGAIGGAAAFAVGAVTHAVMYQFALARTLRVSLLPRGFGRIYVALGLMAAAILIADAVFALSLWVGVPLVAAAWLMVLIHAAGQLQVDRTFPELLRVPVLGGVLRRALASTRDRDDSQSRHRDELGDALEGAVAPTLTELGGPPYRAEVVRTRRRRRITIFDFDLAGAAGSVPVLVKAFDPGRADGTGRGRSGSEDVPRLGVPANPGWIIDGERSALRAITDHLGSLGDPRFEAVRVFDALPRGGVVAMERLPYPTLRRVIQRTCLRPWRESSGHLLTASANAGAWLRAFHSMPPLSHCVARHTTRGDFIDSLWEFAGFLTAAGQDRDFLRRVVIEASAAAEVHLPDDLPCGVGHGDYAPRNVLVAPTGRVAVIDTSARWWFPVYLDVGYFLAGLRTLLPRGLTGGLLPTGRTLDDVERAFLTGYFGNEPQEAAPVRLYEIQSLLARWASTVHGRRGLSAKVSSARRVLHGSRVRVIRRCLVRALESLGRRTKASRPMPAAVDRPAAAHH